MSIYKIGSLLLLCTLTSLKAADLKTIQEFWFSGAEISHFELSQSRYEAQHTGHVEFIFVTEPFLVQGQVKHEFGKRQATDVLKLNALRTFNTGIYSYRTMTSTFRPIELEHFPHALKTTTSIQDWCGQTFQQINYTTSGWHAELRSYFQLQADKDLELPESYLEDELWLLIRLAPEALPVGTFKCVTGALDTRFHLRPIEVSDAIGTLNKGLFSTTYTLSYPQLDRELVIKFESKFPHIIQEWAETNQGQTTTAVLKKRVMHSEYWSENQPSDANKRRKLGLSPVAD